MLLIEAEEGNGPPVKVEFMVLFCMSIICC